MCDLKLLIAALICVMLAGCAAQRLQARVVRVVDGDTLVCMVDGKREKVRLIGVDCPESRPNAKLQRDARADKCHTAEELMEAGKQAKAFTKKWIGDGQVELELDELERDRYGRLLAYVWKSGRMLNSALVREGYAEPMTIPPNTRRYEYFMGLR